MNPGTQQPILFYDGVCALCNGFVKFVLRHDKNARFRFAALQSDLARSSLAPLGIDTDALSSLVVLDEGQAFVRSDAVIRICDLVGYPWKVISLIRFLPRIIRDGVYNIVACIRYRLFGKYEVCPMPDKQVRDRFL